MNDYPWRIQIIYAVVLSLLLLFVFLPISIGWQIIGSIIVLSIAGWLLWRMKRYQKILASSTANMDFLTQKLDLLPARQRYRLPILLVVGNAAKEFFPDDLSLAESNIIVSSEAVWIYVDEYAQLPIVFDSLVTKWPDMLGRIGIYLAVSPEKEDKQGLFIAKLQAFRQSWTDTCRIAKYRLPVYVSAHIGLNGIVYNEESPLPVYWFQLIEHKLYLSDRYLSPLNNWVNDYKITSTEREQRLRIRPLLNELKDWFENVVLTALSDPKLPISKCIPTATAIYPVSQKGIDNNLIEKLWVDLTTLSLPNTRSIQEIIAPPDQLIKFMPISYPFSPIKKMICGLIIITSFFVMGCLFACYWNNIKLAQRIHNDIHHYDLIATTSYEEKLQNLNVLKADREELNNYFKQGEPVRLGFGLYRGYSLLEPLNQAISRYVAAPPKAKIEKVIETVIKEPKVIRLDSLSLFESGQSKLKPESTKVLINALIEMKNQIKANQDSGWLVLITGHTDSTGNPNKNQQLSLDRAAAVRDWLIHTSDIPETCFAIQGYGANQPLVSNDTPENRAKNRRVEINLVPQASKCELVSEN